MGMRVIITGSTGMVGEGVLHECLLHHDVEQVLIVNRRTLGVNHPKLREIVHQDFLNFTPIEDELGEYDACFFCMGVTSVGKSEAEYKVLTYDVTLGFATLCLKHNPGMTFCYVSGSGTDSSERGKVMWARVKGKTENDLMRLPFKRVFAFRPGYMQPTKGLKNTLAGYRWLGWAYPLWRVMFPSFVTTLKEVGIAMIHVAQQGYVKPVIEVRDIIAIARR
ncbi:MAG: epimerase [Bacteroidia bacterium]|nr:epimerase [Bacteroidia bacterium]